MIEKRLRDIRKQKNMTQEEVAKKIEVGRTTYAMYEQGRREPDYETLKKICELFEVSYDYLLNGSEQSNENLYFFDLEGLSEEQIEEIKGHIDYVKWKHKKKD
ncbi:helix-turn-helix domain-containing protein [Alkalibacillus haloalkaliphilus]|uniref:helix-turn-helix domain-containing protein n=1 Tax=Alkalibacillus haloalkaliphilus TaxID=94136 RepID=UPI0002DCFE8A|nr:helix-turn-helix transcriptional regulator [Alkalibacillus haloalkaliphilus]